MKSASDRKAIFADGFFYLNEFSKDMLKLN
jgi:hypothetical protein